jgi:hypothetical protein
MPHGYADFEQVPPISLFGVVDSLARDEARLALGLPLDKTIALVTLGSGMLGEVAGPGSEATRVILEESDWDLAITRPSMARNLLPLDSSARVHEIRGVYPLVRYLKAFDLAVSSAGYNAVHELLPAGVPTILVANTATRTDDQSSRALSVADAGLALAIEDHDLAGLRDSMRKMLDPATRRDLASATADTSRQVGGAGEAARLVTNYAERYHPRSRRWALYAYLLYQSTKEALKRIMGPALADRVKKAMGRAPSVSGQRTVVTINVESTGPESIKLSFSEVLSPGMLTKNPSSACSTTRLTRAGDSGS